MSKSTYQFKRLTGDQSKLLVCPSCLETLTQQDIENYSACPYCDYHLKPDRELEDFLMEPVAEYWASQYDINFSDFQGQGISLD